MYYRYVYAFDVLKKITFLQRIYQILHQILQYIKATTLCRIPIHL